MELVDVIREHLEHTIHYREVLEHYDHAAQMRAFSEILEPEGAPRDVQKLAVLEAMQVAFVRGLNGTSLQYVLAAAAIHNGYSFEDMQELLSFQEPTSFLTVDSYHPMLPLALQVMIALCRASAEADPPEPQDAGGGVPLEEMQEYMKARQERVRAFATIFDAQLRKQFGEDFDYEKLLEQHNIGR